MSGKDFPLTKSELKILTNRYPTPFYLYDDRALRQNIRRIIQAFSIFPSFKEHFAVKALPNPFILKILAEEGCGADCSSYPELLLADMAGIQKGDIMFSSNETPAREYKAARDLDAIINLDDFTHIDFLEKNAGIPEIISCRYNPGSAKGGNLIIGKPEEAKFGFTREQIIRGFSLLQEKGAKHFGLHTMVASNELKPDYHIETARLLFELAVEIKEKTKIKLKFINLGGGVGIPYRPEDEAVDYDYLAQGIKKEYDRIIVPAKLHPLEIRAEWGRAVTGPYGWLVTQALHTKSIYREYIGLDACMADLMRPGLYEAYHHITVLGKESVPATETYDVVGGLCENNDKFAVRRRLPKIDPGDFVIIHDAGAHGRAMGFNYNGKLRCGELLLRPDGSVIMIRRPETVDDYFATLDLNALRDFSASITPVRD
jgi:diaminopimelate decarboxylase